ncbi:MAG: VWA domain-containing protein [Pseudomonadota bacterium]
MQLTRGQRLRLTDLIGPDLRFQIGLDARVGGTTPDFACFGLDGAGKLADERYMTFFNQPTSPCGGVSLLPGSEAVFAFDLQRLPASLERLVITATVDAPVTLGQLSSGSLRVLDGPLETGRFDLQASDYAAERALMLLELYRKDGQWRVAITGQGFNGGLAALVEHFGGEVAAPAAAPQQSAARINLEKRLEKEAPHLISLVKKAAVSLEKKGMTAHRAKVCLCLDISASMSQLYDSGQVQAFAERVLALGCQFDDDGEIDVFLFGKDVHQPEPMGLGNNRDYVQQISQRHKLEFDTRYGAAMQAIRRFYFPDSAGGARTTPHKAQVPVYVMFITDGTTSDQAVTQQQLRWSSNEPIFWQFMGIGRGRKGGFFGGSASTGSASDFPFLEKLDDLEGRLVDNADFFSVSSPGEHPDEALYDLLMNEYPGWVQLARQNGLLG